MLIIILQFLLLTATSAGWGYWLKRLLKIDSPWSLSLSTLLFGAGANKVFGHLAVNSAAFIVLKRFFHAPVFAGVK